ncbi:hypothetical protein C8J56DRAFT_980121 [Mycena floridula]|nr:hypothetical protein C8J56DRAFT_980121 [Mycena floridula]
MALLLCFQVLIFIYPLRASFLVCSWLYILLFYMSLFHSSVICLHVKMNLFISLDSHVLYRISLLYLGLVI